MKTKAQKMVTITMTMEEAEMIILGLREIYLYDNEYYNEVKEKASEIAGNIREAMYEQ